MNSIQITNHTQYIKRKVREFLTFLHEVANPLFVNASRIIESDPDRIKRLMDKIKIISQKEYFNKQSNLEYLQAVDELWSIYEDRNVKYPLRKMIEEFNCRNKIAFPGVDKIILSDQSETYIEAKRMVQILASPDADIVYRQEALEDLRKLYFSKTTEKNVLIFIEAHCEEATAPQLRQ